MRPERIRPWLRAPHMPRSAPAVLWAGKRFELWPSRRPNGGIENLPRIIYNPIMGSEDVRGEADNDVTSVHERTGDPTESDAQEPAKYLRSTIAFPYTGLKDAEQIARALHDSWGGSASPDQLAASPTLDASPRSGAFRTKIATARTFRVITISRGSIALTDLGRQLVDPQTRAAARVEAFLTVPMFAALVNAYRGTTLPPDQGLERKIRELGVSAKQTAKARQAFQRSAELAGFFKMGKDRLVQPANLPGADELVAPKHEPIHGGLSLASTDDLPAPLPELWLTLLRDGRAWSPEKIQEFVEAARTLHGLLAKGS